MRSVRWQAALLLSAASTSCSDIAHPRGVAPASLDAGRSYSPTCSEAPDASKDGAASSCVAAAPLGRRNVLSRVFEGICTDTETPQWGFLGWNITPATGTKVTLRVRSASKRSALPQARFTTIGELPPDPPVCGFTGRSSCPKDLFTALGDTLAARRLFLEIEIESTLVTDGAGVPILNELDPTYSCLPSR